MMPDKSISIESVLKTELQDFHNAFYMYLIKQLQPLPYVFHINGAQTVFRKTELDHHLGYVLVSSIVVECQCTSCPLE